MVQKKVPKKPALHADHVQTEQHHDLKNNNHRVADLILKKKKMKKSGSVKARPPENTVLSLKRHAKQPGNPPPPPPSSAAAIPNYMKPTTSSDARKEVSSTKRTPKTSAHKSIKTSTVLKTTRTLTKNPSFKPSRGSVRRCSTVVLCENLDSQRATCSSTLKDCKFPAYLSLSPGGTESQGTSAIKVCPYTYCSLNGHHHPPLPPLKSFLSARRRSLKAQRSVKLGCLSPKRVKGSGDGARFDDKLLIQDGLKSLEVISPLIEDEQKDFFVEIYSKEIEAREVLYHNLDFDYVSGKNQVGELDEEVSPPVLIQEERKPTYCELDSEESDMDWETGYNPSLHLDYDYEYSNETEVEPDPEEGEVEDHPIHDEFVIKSDDKGGCFDDFFADDEVSQESFDEEGLNSDAFSASDDGESTCSYDYLLSLDIMKTSAIVEVSFKEPKSASDDNYQVLFECQTIENQDIVEEETSFDNIKYKSLSNEDSVAVTGNHDEIMTSSNEGHQVVIEFSDEEPHFEVVGVKSTETESPIRHKMETENASNQETEDSAMARAIAKSKKAVQGSDDETGLFNPRGPNFLPLEPDPEAEKVDLRHQDLDERKNSEEWMVDYALRQVVTKLGPARKRKVALLVEAFEKVMPITKCELHLRHGSAFDQTRPIQACS